MADATVSKDKWFYFVGGKSAKDVEELVSRLKEITGEEFAFHVNGAKNDFANWIEGVFYLKDLADELRKVMERKDTIHILKKHLHQNKALLPGFTKEELIEHAPPHELLEYKPSSGDVINPPKYSSKRKIVEEKEDVDFEKAAESLAKELHFDDAQDAVPALSLNSKDSFLVTGDREITGAELKEIAVDASRELKIDGRTPVMLHTVEHQDPDHHGRFIVKEFIYGFVIGLIFGLIMLGTLYNVGGV